MDNKEIKRLVNKAQNELAVGRGKDVWQTLLKLNTNLISEAKRLNSVASFKIRMQKAWYIKHYAHSSDYDSWRTFKIGGVPQEEFRCSCSHDCCACHFCWHVTSYLWGFITIGHYGVNV